MRDPSCVVSALYQSRIVFTPCFLSVLFRCLALRKEFELDSRYNDLSLKLNIINEDARYSALSLLLM
jgi:hypothetical protein